jgi:hypothetical protein
LRPFAVAPEVPKDRVNALRKAFMETMADNEFLAEDEKAKLEIRPASGVRIGSQTLNVYHNITPEPAAAAGDEIGDGRPFLRQAASYLSNNSAWLRSRSPWFLLMNLRSRSPTCRRRHIVWTVPAVAYDPRGLVIARRRGLRLASGSMVRERALAVLC